MKFSGNLRRRKYFAHNGRKQFQRRKILNQWLQRVHVTGGTTGITIEHSLNGGHLPSFINRAEDQAYAISSILGQNI